MGSANSQRRLRFWFAKSVLEIHALAFDHEGAVLHEGKDGADVLADDAEAHQLHGSKKEDADHERGDAKFETVPEDKLVDQVKDGYEYGQEAGGHAGEGRHTEGNLGEVGNAEHRHIVERVPVIAGEASQASRLLENDLLVGETDLGNHAAEVWVRVFEALDDVADLAVIEAETGEVFVRFNIRDAVHEAIVPGANPEHQAVFFAGLLEAEHHFKTALPILDHFFNELGRILQVRDQADNRIALGLIESVHGGADVAEVARIGDYLHVSIFSGELLQHREGAVGGLVIDEDVFVAVAAELRDDGTHPGVHFADVQLFVVT